MGLNLMKILIDLIFCIFIVLLYTKKNKIQSFFLIKYKKNKILKKINRLVYYLSNNVERTINLMNIDCKKDIIREGYDYEDYDVNVVTLTEEEERELGVVKKQCCKQGGSCSKTKKCCESGKSCCGSNKIQIIK